MIPWSLPQAEDRRYPPQVLREYALIADGERGALVGPLGELVWMCWPRWHSEPVFSTLVGDAGVYAVTPRGRFVWGGHYEDATLIWRSRWITTGGVVESREALAFPGDPRTAVILREVTAADAAAEISVELDARAGFGGAALSAVRRDDGGWTGRVGQGHLRWSGDVGQARALPGERGDRLALTAVLRPGERLDLVLELSERPFAGGPPDPARLWRATGSAWAQAVPPLRDLLGTRDARRAYAVMRGMTSADGGMVAAATTSLPERAEAGRNYDYRYAWIRDQCLAGEAAAAAGADDLLDRAVRFIGERLRADGPRLAPAYTVDGGEVPDQRRVGLEGYPGGFDLVGNHVNRQFQLDGFGESLLLLAAAARRGRLDGAGWRAARIAAEAVGERWREPDAGIWEIEDREWTHSRLVCAAGLRASADAAEADGRWAPSSRGRAAAWRALADEIVAHAAARATHPSGRWQRSPDDPGLDGALLMPPLRGALPATDRRTTGTLRAYLSELTRDGYAYRFRHGRERLGEAEGAFLLCGFLTAMACHQQGETVEAARWFERQRAACGPPGLFTEEYDVAQRQLRGNLPQAFVHATMLESAARLSRPWDVPADPS